VAISYNQQIIKNEPVLWQGTFPQKTPSGHKYAYGHAVIYGGPAMPGAAILAALSALRVGAGLCSIVGSVEAKSAYLAAHPCILYEPCQKALQFPCHNKDKRRNALLIGPGAGASDRKGLRRAVLETLAQGRACVLDADALNVFQGQAGALFSALHAHCVLTPHEGEFARLFPGLEGTRQERAGRAAQITGAVIVLKGSETVIACPDGRMAININAPSWLATAGAGDVLAGLILGLLAQNMPPFDAACAATWMHGAAAERFGPGLIASDLPEIIPSVLQGILQEST
jgi:NAD(P)H-hydrate epimerase